MALKPRITDDEVDRMIVDYEDHGLMIKDLVKKYGRKAITIRNKFNERGIKIEYNRSRRVDTKTKDRIIPLYKSGKTIKQVAIELDISHGLVGDILKSHLETRSGIQNEWTKEDYSHLENLLEDRSRPIAEIASILNRSYDAIVDKVCKKYPRYKRQHQGYGVRQDFKGTTYRSLGETQLARLFYENFINFEYEKSVSDERKWTCDFYLKDYDLWVEYDGLGSARRSPISFQEKIEYYKNKGYNHKVVTKDTRDILNALGLKINHQYDIDIREIDKATSDLFLSRVHYLKGSSRRDKYRLGFYHGDTLIGVVTFGSIANPNETNIALNRCAVLDRARAPHPYNNLTSWMVSRSLRWLKQQDYRGTVVSWSDPRFHNGTLYKACNFTLVDNKMRSDYIYVDSDGVEYHKSKCRVRAGESELDKAKSLGLTKIKIPPKHRWEFIIR